jgi:hypothetical protein
VCVAGKGIVSRIVVSLRILCRCVKLEAGFWRLERKEEWRCVRVWRSCANVPGAVGFSAVKG